MKVTWELNTDSPVDAQILNGLHKLVEFVASKASPQTAGAAGAQPVPAKTAAPQPKAAEAAPATPSPATKLAKTAAPQPKAAEAAPATPSPATKPAETQTRKRQPKVKTKDQLIRLSLNDMLDYLEARKEHNLLECRVLAKHYNDEYGEIDSILELLHKNGANNFDDLKNVEDFISGACGMCRRKAAEKRRADKPQVPEDMFGV